METTEIDGPTTFQLQPDSSLLVSIGDTVQVRAVFTGVHSAVLEWSTSDPTIAFLKVDDVSARVTAMGNGVAQVVATWDNLVDTATVVVQQAAHRVALDPVGASLKEIGAEQGFAAQAFDANGHPVGFTDVDWRSLNPSLATIDQNGVASASAVGQVTLEAEIDGVAGYALLTVTARGLPGRHWSRVSRPRERLTKVWGSSANDIVAVDGNGGTLQFNGTFWYPTLTGVRGWQSVWGTAGQYYVVGPPRVIHHFFGSGRGAMSSGTSVGLRDVWGAALDDAFAVGLQKTIVHFDGTSWRVMMSDPNGPTLYGVSGTSSSDVYAVGLDGTILYYNGSTWRAMNSGTRQALTAVFAAAPGKAFAVGEHGTILQYARGTWEQMSSGTDQRLTRIWGSGVDDVFAVGRDGTILHFDGTAWSHMAANRWEDLYGVWGSSSTNVYAVGAGRSVAQFDGVAWKTADEPSPPGATYRGIWGLGPTDVYAVSSEGLILHTDGSAWTSMQSGTHSELRSVWGPSKDNVYAVGDSGLVLHFDGRSWSSQPRNTQADLHAVWGLSPTDVFTVGNAGTILHFDGAQWSSMVSGTAEDLWDVWGTSTLSIFATGEQGTLLHYDGVRWSPMASGTTQWLLSLWGTGPDEVFVGGGTGTVLRYDGNRWTRVPIDTPFNREYIVDLWGTSATDLYALLWLPVSPFFGYVFHYDGSRWSQKGDSSVPLWAMWGSSTGPAYALGTRGMMFRARP